MTTTLRELEKRLEKEPENLSLRVMVAGLMSEAGRKGEAVELYRSVAIAYREQGRNQQAIAVCRSILELAPDDGAIHALLAELATGRASDALEPGTLPPVTGTGTNEPRRTRTPSAQEPTATGMRAPPEPRPPTAPPPITALGSQRIGPATAPPPGTTTPPAGTPRPKGTAPPKPVTAPPPARTPSQPPATTKAALIPQRPLVPSPAGAKPPSRPPASTRTPPAGAPAAKPAPGIPGAPRRVPGELDTPLPRAVPYHVADPTTSPARIPKDELDTDLPTSEGAETNPGRDPATPGSSTSGLAQAARRISGLIAQDQLPRDSELDLAAELDTRQVVRVSAAELEKVARPPPTLPVEMVDGDDLHDLPTPPPPRTITWGRPATSPAIPIRDTPVDPPTGLDHPPARDTDDELTAPRELVGADPLANAFFVPLPANRRESVLARCTRRSVRAGTTVIRQGETAHPLVLVVAGKLELRVERANGTLAMVDTIDAGQYIGEAALLGRMPAPANVIAATDCELLALPPHALFELAGAYPALWAALKDTAERRTRQYERAIRGAT